MADNYDILRACIEQLKRKVAVVPIQIVARGGDKGEASKLSGDLAAAMQRATTAEGELVTLRTRVAELERLPDPSQQLPYKMAERTLLPFADSPSPDTVKLREQLDAAVARSKEPTLPEAERTQLATTISSLRQRLQALGEAA